MAKLLKPEGKWNGKTVALCDGHGMGTPGKRTPYIKELGRQIRENEFNRKVVDYLAQHLLDCGFRVLLVAPTDADVPLHVRTADANRYSCDVYVSVHYNAMGWTFGYSRASGISVHIYNGPLNRKTKHLAECVGKHLRKGTKQVYRGIKRNNFHVLRETAMPAILTENGFMDDPEEARLMLKTSFQKEVAEEHAEGICEFFGVSFKKSKPVVKLLSGDEGKYFKVIYDKPDEVNIYNIPNMKANPYATYKKGITRRILATLDVDGYKMFKFRGGDDEVYYISTRDDLVSVIEKPDPVEKKEEEDEMPEKAIVINSEVDINAAYPLHLRTGYPFFDRRVAEKEQVAKHLIVCGGGTKGLKAVEFTDLSGKSRYETAENIEAYLKK